MLTELQKAARNGCKIVSVNPLPETGMIRFKNPQEPLSLLGTGTQIALPVPAGARERRRRAVQGHDEGDAGRRIAPRGGKLLAHDFIAHHTEGFDALVRDLDATPLGRDRRRRAACRAS